LTTCVEKVLAQQTVKTIKLISCYIGRLLYSQSIMDNPDTQVTLGTRQRTQTIKTKTHNTEK